MRSKNEDIFRRLCIKAITGNINEDENRLLNTLLSGENKNEYEKLQAVWKKSELRGLPEEPDSESEWLELNARIRNYENNIRSNKKANRKHFISFNPALSAALFIIFFLSLWFLWDLEIKKPGYELVSTGNKEHREISFADGSRVLLNSGSSVGFPSSFEGKERKITLKGEGFFSIARDGRPFRILTGNAAVTVLGTKFNVRSRSGKTEVYVKDGRVNLAPQEMIGDKKIRSVVLSKGELSTLVENGMPAPPVKSDPDPQLGWMEGKLVFNRRPLPEIVEEMERFYDVRITLRENSLKSYSLSGSFKSAEIENVLGMICLALDLNYAKAPGSGDQDSKAEYIIELKK